MRTNSFIEKQYYLKIDKDTYLLLSISDGIINREPNEYEIKLLNYEKYEFDRGFNIYITVPKNRKELKEFIELFNPSLRWCAWWERRYGTNNWRKLHSLPMIRKWGK